MSVKKTIFYFAFFNHNRQALIKKADNKVTGSVSFGYDKHWGMRLLPKKKLKDFQLLTIQKYEIKSITHNHYAFEVLCLWRIRPSSANEPTISEQYKCAKSGKCKRGRHCY